MSVQVNSGCAYQASSTWRPSFPVFAEWPTMALIHSTKEATGCQCWSQWETPSWSLHPTCSFQSSDERHSYDLTEYDTNLKKHSFSIQSPIIFLHATEFHCCLNSHQFPTLYHHHLFSMDSKLPQTQEGHLKGRLTHEASSKYDWHRDRCSMCVCPVRDSFNRTMCSIKTHISTSPSVSRTHIPLSRMGFCLRSLVR